MFGKTHVTTPSRQFSTPCPQLFVNKFEFGIEIDFSRQCMLMYMGTELVNTKCAVFLVGGGVICNWWYICGTWWDLTTRLISVIRIAIPERNSKGGQITVELGCNVMKGTKYSVSL
jgi:hypothetical protein